MAHDYMTPHFDWVWLTAYPRSHAFWKIWSAVGSTGDRYLGVIMRRLKEPRVPKVIEL